MFFTQSYIQSLSHTFSHSVAHSDTQSLSRTFSYSVTHSVTQSHIKSLSHTFSHSVTYKLWHTFSHSVKHSVTQSHIQSLSHTFSHSVTNSVTHSVTHSILTCLHGKKSFEICPLSWLFSAMMHISVVQLYKGHQKVRRYITFFSKDKIITYKNPLTNTLYSWESWAILSHKFAVWVKIQRENGTKCTQKLLIQTWGQKERMTPVKKAKEDILILIR